MQRGAHRRTRLVAVVALVGLVALALAVILRPADARAAAAQDWSPFVLVAGLLLVGLVADEDGWFAWLGDGLAWGTRGGWRFFATAALITGVVSALLNLDTSVAFLTPDFLYAARRRGGGEAPVLYGVLLWSNAGSLLLPGSNLTNLIVLGPAHLTGAAFLARMWLPALAALAVTAVVVAVVERRDVVTVAASAPPIPARRDVRRPLGLVAVAASAVAVLTLAQPAPVVAAVGVVAAATRVARGSLSPRRVRDTIGLATLVGLFALAVAFGTLGRVVGASATLFHLAAVPTAVVAAVATVAINNLPAASLLAAHPVSHPFALLVGLNLGPNLAVTGSLAWLIWLRAARGAGVQPSLARAMRAGALAVPVSITVALAALAATGHA